MMAANKNEIGAISTIGPFAAPSHAKYERLIARAKEVPAAPTVVVYPCDETSLRGPIEAAEAGIIVPILVGPAAKICAVAREHGLAIDRCEIVDVPHSAAAAAKGVELIRESKGELLMKGSLHTDELMHEIASSKTGLRTARRISHVYIMDVPTYAETLFLTDAISVTLTSFSSIPGSSASTTSSVSVSRTSMLGMALVGPRQHREPTKTSTEE
jgi:phosphotransacetylase